MKTSQQAGIDVKVLYDINQRIDTLTRAIGMVDSQAKEAIKMLVHDMTRITLHLNFVLKLVEEGRDEEETKKKFDEFTKKFIEDHQKMAEAFANATKEKEKEEKEKGIIVT